MDALDLPNELTEVQNAYWESRREWISLERAYQRVIRDMLNQRENRIGEEAQRDDIPA